MALRRQNQRVVISGASSFLGQRLVGTLGRDGATIATVTRQASPVPNRHAVEVGLLSSDDHLIERLVDFDPTAIVHMAAAGGFGAAIDELPALLAATVELGCKLLETSANVIGTPPVIAIGSFSERSSEGGAVFPASLYSATKAALMPFLQYYHHQRGVPAVVLQPTDIYGAGDWRHRLLDLIVESITDGRSLDATAGEQIVSFIHVDDVCDAITHTIELAQAGVVDAASVPEFTVNGPEVGRLRDLVERAVDALGVDANLRWGARPYRDGEVMRADLRPLPPGWTPRIGLVDGLAEMFKEKQC